MRECVRGWLLAACAAMAGAAGAAEPLQDLPLRYAQFKVDYVVNDDATSTETRSWAMTVLKPQAVEWAKRTSVSYSTSVQKLDVLEAYTRKADGRRIDVPKENYQLNVNKGREEGGPVFSDFSSMSVVFPDLAAGDTVVFAYRIVQTEPIFPGHFDTGLSLPRQVAYDDVQASVEFPSTLPARFAAREMEQKETDAAAGRRRVQWRWSNPKPLRSDRQDWTVIDPDKEVGFDFSTFADHATIAAAYGQRATPKAAVTERIRALAAEIVGSRSAPADQARAIYDWVATKITYGGNCVGVGTVVPRDLDFVLDNRMGDCKDHATLLQALLAARGIESQQALVNAGSVYTLTKIPRVSGVNHVINHIPSLNLYVDSTSSTTPFGTLPAGLRGKPVLLVGGGTATLPVPAMASEQRTVTRLKIAPDGSASGTVEIQFKGDVAASMREGARQLTPEARADMAKNALRSMGMNGDGQVELDDATELTDSFRMKFRLDRAEKFIRFPGSGAFHLMPLAGGLTVASIARPDTGEPIDHPGTCTNGTAIEEYTIELPKAMKIMALPPKAKAANNLQRFEAAYAVKGNVLQARRVFEDRTPVAVCSVEQLKEFELMGARIYDNLKEQVLYR